MVNDNTIPLSIPDSELSLPLSVGLVSPKSEMLLPASKPKVAVSMVLNEDKTKIVKTEELLFDDFNEETKISIIKQELDCDNGQTETLFKPRAIKREASDDAETYINADNAENSDWIIKNEEVHIKFEGGEDDHQESSSISPSRRDKEDKKHQMQQTKKGNARRSKKVHKRGQRIRHCPHCGLEPSRQSNLRRHIRIVHEKGEGLEKYSCPKCTFQTLYKRILADHILRHDGVKGKQHRCRRCGYSTHRRKGLTEHVCDKEQAVLTCYVCGYQTIKKDSLRRHVLCHPPIKNSALSFKKYKCTKCDYQSRLKSDLKRHGLVHRTDKVTTYSCYYCDYQVQQKRSLTRHVLLHSKHYSAAKILKCPECDFKSVYKNSLKYHLLRHKKGEEISMEKCDRCDYSTFRKCNLKRHKRTHDHSIIPMER